MACFIKLTSSTNGKPFLVNMDLVETVYSANGTYGEDSGCVLNWAEGGNYSLVKESLEEIESKVNAKNDELTGSDDFLDIADSLMKESKLRRDRLEKMAGLGAVDKTALG